MTAVCMLCTLAAAPVLAKPKQKVVQAAAAPQPKAAGAAGGPAAAVPESPAAAASGPQPGAAGVVDGPANVAPVKAAAEAPDQPAAHGGTDDEHAEAAVASGGEAKRAPVKAQPKLSPEQLASLRAESSQLIDDMAQARAKASLLGKTLFKTQLRLRVQNLAGPDPRLTKLVLKLDGAPVFVADPAALSGDDVHKIFEGFIAPGQHVLTAELKQQSRKDATFGYSLHDAYNFKAQRDKLSELTLILDDDSDMADDYPDDGDGEYDVRLKLRVRTKNIGEE